MKVLTVNPGSGSLRLHVVRTEDEQVLHSAEIGHPADEAAADVKAFVDDAGELDAVAHRLVHGGPDLDSPAVVTPEVRKRIANARSLAPEHVPHTETLLDELTERLPDIPHIVCPDTAFHRDLPAVARTYPLPERWRARWDLRRYGFHGLSFGWAVRRAAELLNQDVGELNLLIAHLSGGCSVTAVAHGRSVDTSMGFTPLEGTMMAKRSGTVDPGMLLWLLREGHLTVDELEDGLYHHSGLLGLSGTSEDTRDLVRDARGGDVTARFALAVFEHRTRRELAAMAASLDRVDALVFTGDIGWDQPEVAEAVAGGLGVLGITGGLDTRREQDAVISGQDAATAVLTVRSREELSLAHAAAATPFE
ncbi:acetate kinase [Amycolatopsis sp. NPDC051071]|uniref:acetate/propionate family kinase n=1 Tax=Amycolatopsis sp. NPDC051071 TaxID=3154637 RepID=UPI00344314CB